MGQGPFASLFSAATAPAPAGVFPASGWFGGNSGLISTDQPSSNSGVPPATSSALGAGTSGSVINWASSKVASGPLHQPAFLALIALAVSVLMLSHVARLQVKS